jgi:hypothetical protein
MNSYIVSDFSFNIGETVISQQYVNSLKLQVPWGINLTYIYKDSALDTQFVTNNKHLVIENKNVDGNIILKTQGTGKIIINDLSVNLINSLPYSGTITATNLSPALSNRLDNIEYQLQTILAQLETIEQSKLNET